MFSLWKKYFVCASLLLILLSCEDNAVEPASGVLKVRVENLTDYTLSQIVVNTSGGENIYAHVEPGRKSAYKDFDFAFSICSMSFKVGSQHYRIQPYDYVGETLFEDGFLTYRVTLVDFSSGNFSVQGIPD